MIEITMKNTLFYLDIAALLSLIIASITAFIHEGFTEGMPWAIATLWCITCLIYKYNKAGYRKAKEDKKCKQVD